MNCTTLALSVGLVLALLLLPTPGQSGEIKLGSSNQPSCVDTPHQVICLHYFEQEKVWLEKLLAGLCDDLQVRLIQPGSRLYAEVGEPLLLPAGFCHHKERVYMKLPRVKRTVAFELQVLANKQNQSWVPVKSLPILVYPNDLLQPLKAWAQKNLLQVTGQYAKLIAFLDKENIAYTTHNTYSDKNKVILHVGDLRAAHPDYREASSRIIVFKEAVVDLPQIRVIATRYGPRIIVEMKLLDALPESPLVQKVFMKIFKMALDFNHNLGG